MLSRDLRQVWPAKANVLERLEIDRHVCPDRGPPERYTLSLPGTIDDRVSPLDRSIRNMSIAGDWTACGIDAGCVEAAVMSGMLAVHAISASQQPDLESIVGFIHP